jgi:hypothetical protein
MRVCVYQACIPDEVTKVYYEGLVGGLKVRKQKEIGKKHDLY